MHFTQLVTTDMMQITYQNILLPLKKSFSICSTKKYSRLCCGFFLNEYIIFWIVAIFTKNRQIVQQPIIKLILRVSDAFKFIVLLFLF